MEEKVCESIVKKILKLEEFSKPMKAPAFLFIFRQSTKEDWKGTAYWFGFHILGALMPIWATACILMFLRQPVHLFDLAKNGEFALYSAAFIGPAILAIINYSRKHRYVLGPGSAFLAIAILLLSAFIYAIVASFTTRHEEGVLNMGLVVRVSYALFSISLLMSLLVAFIENQAANLNLRDEEAKDQKLLQARFQTRLAKEEKEEEHGGQ